MENKLAASTRDIAVSPYSLLDREERSDSGNDNSIVCESFKDSWAEPNKGSI